MGVLVKAIDVLHEIIEDRMMNQREPRLHDPGYLNWLRKKPCCVCGKPAPSDACHIRFASEAYGKRPVGLGEKPDDKWAIPMCRECHMSQHSCNEREWWRERRMLPLLLSQKYYSEFGGDGGRARHKRKPRSTTKGIKKTTRRIPSRPFPKKSSK